MGATPNLKNLSKFLQIAKFSSIFKGPDVLPRGFQILGKQTFMFFKPSSCHDMQDMPG